jgi:hypothetical protein
MTTFKEIRGTTIEVVSSDPSNPELGQIWYNSSSGTLKGYLLQTVNAWASGGNLNTARWHKAGAGTQTAALAFGGQTPFQIQEQTEFIMEQVGQLIPGLGTARRIGRIWNSNSCISDFGGYPPGQQYTATESWNGSSWTPTRTLNTARNLI